MLVNPREWFRRALDDEFAVAGFTVGNIEIAAAIMLAAEEARAPVVIEVGEDAATFYGLKPLTGMISALAEEVDCPVALHLSYARHLNFVQACVEAGFTSVAIDDRGQAQEIGEYARDRNVWVEGLAASLIEAEKLIEEMGIDGLSLTLGAVPGAFTGREYLQLGFLSEVEKKFPQIPLSVRGVSRLAQAHILQLRESHVSKIVVGSEILKAYRQACGEASRSADLIWFQEIQQATREAVKALATEKIQLFGSNGQGTL